MKKLFLAFVLIFGLSKVNALEIYARSAILFDMNNNKVIYEKNSHEVRSVASISNLMTTRKK